MMPSVPEEQLAEGGWSPVEETTEVMFEIAAVRVEGHTLLYDDATLREAITAAADGLDGPWRFFFATRLAFVPPLSPGVGPAMLLGTVTSEARRSFAADLEDRRFRSVERRRTERTRTDTGDRVRLTNYTAEYTVVRPGGDQYELALDGWLGVWVHEGGFRIAGGAYPTRGFDALLAGIGADASAPPAREYREELLDLITGVE